MKKLIYITVIVLLINACKGGRDYGNYLYEIINLDITNANNSGDTPTISSATSISKDAYAIHIKYTMEQVGTSGDYLVSNESGIKNKHTTTLFNITCTTSFDSLHPAGNSLNDLFLYTNGRGYNQNNIVTTNHPIGEWGGTGEASDIWVIEEYLILMYPPTNNGNYTFIIDVEQSNGTRLNASVSINLN